MSLKNLFTKTVTIANGASLSEGVYLGGEMSLVGINMPSGWTAAVLTFQSSMSPNTPTQGAPSDFQNAYDDAANEVTYQTAASRNLMLSQNVLLAATWLKVRSGTAGAAVNQGGDRVITLIFRPVG